MKTNPPPAESTRKTFKLGVRQHRAVLDFLTAVEDEMERRKMRPVELARSLGKSRSWISKIFRSKPNLTFFTAVEVADAMEMDFHGELRPRVPKVNAFRQAPAWIGDASVPPLRLVYSASMANDEPLRQAS